MPETSKPQSIGALRTTRWRDVPTQSGIYWWYFPPECLDVFGIHEKCRVQPLQLREADSGAVCLYVGIAKSLRERMKWHSEQSLRQSALRSGFLSTFRKTLLALTGIDYATGFEQINVFMDRLDVAWQTTGSLQVAKELESQELVSEYHFPLNIQGNRNPALRDFVRHLKRRRKEYTELHLAGGDTEDG